MIHYALYLMTLLVSLSSPDVSVLFVGDAMAHGPQTRSAQRPDGSYDFSPCFRMLTPEVSRADYAVVNLETPVCGAPYSGYPQFNAPDSYVNALRDAGFDMFLTANNHTMDRGARGLRKTIQLLDSLGLDHIGTYTDTADRSRRLPFIVNIKGIRTGFVNYTYGTNGIPASGGVAVDYIDRERMAADIKALRNAGAEIVIACLHWGEEYRLQPLQSQRELASYLVAQGIDAIIGSHPHVIEPVESITSPITGRQVPVVYSLGNFISNQNDLNSRGGLMVTLRMHRNATQPLRRLFKSGDTGAFAAAVNNLVSQLTPLASWRPGMPVFATSSPVSVSMPECRLLWVVKPSAAQRHYSVNYIDSIPAADIPQAMRFRASSPVQPR